MSIQRVVLASLIAVRAVGVFSAAAASAEGPFWHRNSSKLTQGPVGVNGQSKGNLTISFSIGITITCTASHSTGTIDGQGATLQGQGKGKVKYEGCTMNVANCEISAKSLTERPGTGIIETNQLKTHLATATVQSTEQIVALFEPSGIVQNEGEEKVFTKFAIVKNGTTQCLFEGLIDVRGSVVAQLSPQEAESKEDSLFFPEPAISTIKHEGQEIHPELKLGTAAATFIGYYGQKVQTGTFGVFRS